MARGAKKNKKGFYTSTGKGKSRRGIPFLVSNTGMLVTMGKEKAEVFTNIFALVFTSACSTHGPGLIGLKSSNRGSPLLL